MKNKVMYLRGDKYILLKNGSSVENDSIKMPVASKMIQHT